MVSRRSGQSGAITASIASRKSGSVTVSIWDNWTSANVDFATGYTYISPINGKKVADFNGNLSTPSERHNAARQGSTDPGPIRLRGDLSIPFEPRNFTG